MRYLVKLSFWTTPLDIEATSKTMAEGKALEMYPTCDCCEYKTTVEWVKPAL